MAQQYLVFRRRLWLVGLTLLLGAIGAVVEIMLGLRLAGWLAAAPLLVLASALAARMVCTALARIEVGDDGLRFVTPYPLRLRGLPRVRTLRYEEVEQVDVFVAPLPFGLRLIDVSLRIQGRERPRWLDGTVYRRLDVLAEELRARMPERTEFHRGWRTEPPCRRDG